VAFKRVVTAVLLELNRGVLVKELIDGEVTTSNSDVDLVLVHTDGNTLGTELVDTVTLTHEHNLQLLSVREVVDVLSESLVDLVSLHRDVDGDAGLQVNNVLLEGLDLHHGGFQIELAFLEGLENVKSGLLTNEVLPFKLFDVPSRCVEFVLEGSLGQEHVCSVLNGQAKSLFEVISVTRSDSKFDDDSLKLLDSDVKLSDGSVKIVNLLLVLSTVGLK